MSSVLLQSFKDACDLVKQSNKEVSNKFKLQMYSFFKQATDGDIMGERPGFFYQVQRAKWDAWDALKGTSKEIAMQKYIDLVDKEL